jgi:phage tail sheath protein FI
MDFRPINVRRLLILLRRLALSVGPNYVFEPNSTAFRRSVQRGFESLLNDMFQRGAFAGNSPTASFQVVCDTTVNKPGSVEAGNFIVELRVAPSLPMTFLTIRLVQSATGSIITES